MKLTIVDIILIILILGVLYLLYSPDIDHFTSNAEINDAINEEINNRYSVDLTNMRNLNGLLTGLINNTDQLNIEQNNTKLFDINTNDININGTLNVINKTDFNSDLSVKGRVLPAVNNLTFKNTNITNKIKINQGKFNDIYPKGSILMFSIIGKDYNIPYGWVPCDGSYYDVITADANNLGKDSNGNYVKFYEKSANQPEKRNLDLAHEWKIYNPTIEQLINLRKIGIDKYYIMTGVNTGPFTEIDLKGMALWDRANSLNRGFVDDNKYPPRKFLSSVPIKRDFIYIRKII